MNLLRRSLLCFFTFFTAAPLFAASLSIAVVDQSGAAISNAYVVVRWDAVGSSESTSNAHEKQTTTATTGNDGRFVVDLDKGIYDVFVTAAGFSPHCEKIQLKQNDRKKYEVKL